MNLKELSDGGIFCLPETLLFMPVHIFGIIISAGLSPAFITAIILQGRKGASG